jgi:tRNA pseudouridine55 synthase
VGEDKTYQATIRLGANTVTDDKEGDVLQLASVQAVSAISLPAIEAALGNLRGEIQQVPSSVSAIKVDGQRAYAAVRGGNEVKLAARPVTISRFSVDAGPRLVEGGQYLDIDVTVECSSGTYIRALARDLGAALGVGGHLTALRRTRIGKYSVAQAKKLSELTKENVQLLPAAQAASQQFEVRQLSEQDVIDLRHGKRLAAGENRSKQPLAGIDDQGRLIAILERYGSQLKSLVVFNEVA